MEIYLTTKRATEPQIKKLKKYFPSLEVKTKDEEGFFIPPWKDISSKCYQSAVYRLFGVLQKEYNLKFVNYYKDNKGEHIKTDNHIAINGGYIKEIHVSKRNITAVEVSGSSDIYAIGLYELLVILLTHYDSIVKRLTFVVCPGDRMTSFSESSEFDHIPIIKISSGEICLLSHGSAEKMQIHFALGKN